MINLVGFVVILLAAMLWLVSISTSYSKVKNAFTNNDWSNCDFAISNLTIHLFGLGVLLFQI